MSGILLWILFAAQDDPSKQARELIEKLRSPKVEERVEAEKKLRELGKSAEAELEKATHDKDPEVAGRARSLLVEKTPEGTLKRIEESLVKSKTARLKFRLWAEKGGKLDWAGKSDETLLLKEGNRASYAGHLCDGRKLLGPGWESKEDAPKNFRDGLALLISRVGMTPTIYYAFQLLDTGGLAEAFQETVRTCKVEAVQFGEGDGDAGTLHYGVSFPGHSKKTMSVRLWYDPKTLKVLKRSVEVPGGILWEAYSEWIIDGEIPDEAFKGVDERIADYTREIEKDAKSSSAYLGRARVRSEKGDKDGALEDYTRSIELDPKAVGAYAGRGAMRRRKENYDGAVEDFTKAIELEPSSAAHYRSRAEVYSLKSDHDRVIQDLTKAIQLEPSAVTHYLSRANVYALKSEHDRVIQDCTRALEIDPKSTQALLVRGSAHCFKENFADAITDFDRTGKLGNSVANLASMRALALAGLGKDKEAVEQAEKAFLIDGGGLAYALAGRGLAQLHLNNKGAALADFQQFESFAPEGDSLRPLVSRWKKEAEKEK